MQCPSCDSARVYPSRLRNILEQLRQGLTGKQPVRCHDCGWRRWREAIVQAGENAPVLPDDLRTGRGSVAVSPTDLDQLDAVRPPS